MSLKYPSDVGEGEITACIQIREFLRIGINTATPGETITLYMPSEISCPNEIEWEEGSLREMGTAGISGAAGALKNLITGNLQNKVNKAARVAGSELESGSASRNLRGAKGNLAKVSGVMSKMGSVADLADKMATAAGYAAKEIANPYTVMMFKSVQLRNFSFSWDFYPKSQIEAIKILEIVNKLKGAALPTDLGVGMLKYPSEFELQFLFNGQLNPFMPRFKRCVITSIDANYTGQGVFAMTREGAPAEVKMSISFKEIEILTSVDYDYSIDSVSQFLQVMNPGAVQSVIQG